MGIAVYGGRTEKAVQALLKANGGVLRKVDPDVRTFNMLEARIARREREKREAAELLERRRREANEAIRKANERLRALNKNGTLGTIVERICRAFHITVTELMADRRNVDVVLARQAIFYWACRRTTLSLPEIGRRIGGRDHTTILWGKKVYPQKRAKMGRYLRPVR